MYSAASANVALQGQLPIMSNNMPVGSNISPQSGFLSRSGIWLPIVIHLPTGQARSI